MPRGCWSAADFHQPILAVPNIPPDEVIREVAIGVVSKILRRRWSEYVAAFDRIRAHRHARVSGATAIGHSDLFAKVRPTTMIGRRTVDGQRAWRSRCADHVDFAGNSPHRDLV